MTLDIARSLTWPTEDQDWIRKVGIGSVMNLLAIVLVGPLFATGYLLRTLAAVARGEENLPEWEDWGDLFLKGLFFCIIGLLYGLVPGALFFVGFGSMILGIIGAGARESMAPGVAGMGLAMVLGGLGVVLFLAISFLMPMIMLRYAVTGDFAAAFQFGGIFGGISRSFVDYLVIVAVLLGGGLVAGVLGQIPFLGWLLMLPLSFYLGLIQAHLLGQYYRSHLVESPSNPLPQG